MFRRLVVMLFVGLMSVSVAASARPATDEQQTIDAIHKALDRLPYYGVFDFLAFRYDRGTVTLSGFAYALGLKDDALKAVKRVPGVDEVVNDIVQLPVSVNDDRIRWRTFVNIYNDSFLSRYAPGGGLVRFDRRFLFARQPGTEPFGTYPIHIIVRNGRTLLVGTVDFESDKIAAGFRAREVPGSFGVQNELVVPERGTR